MKQTLGFGEIRAGYYRSDGSHNPHGLIGAQTEINWDSQRDL